MWMKSLVSALTSGAMLLASTQVLAAFAEPVTLLAPLVTGTGVPGGVDPAKPAFSFQFTDYDFVAVGVSLTYDPSVLQFNPSQSTVTYNGVTRTLPDLLLDLGELSGGGFFVDAADDAAGEVYFNAGFTESGSLLLNGTLTVQTAFNLLAPTFEVGTNRQVGIAGLLFVNTDGVYAELIPAISPPTLTISAVPEPEAWMMLLAGMGLLGAVAKRRNRHQ